MSVTNAHQQSKSVSKNSQSPFDVAKSRYLSSCLKDVVVHENSPFERHDKSLPLPVIEIISAMSKKTHLKEEGVVLVVPVHFEENSVESVLLSVLSPFMGRKEAAQFMETTKGYAGLYHSGFFVLKPSANGNMLVESVNYGPMNPVAAILYLKDKVVRYEKTSKDDYTSIPLMVQQILNKNFVPLNDIPVEDLLDVAQKYDKKLNNQVMHWDAFGRYKGFVSWLTGYRPAGNCHTIGNDLLNEVEQKLSDINPEKTYNFSTRMNEGLKEVIGTPFGTYRPLSRLFG